jgi:hypothetical protein
MVLESASAGEAVPETPRAAAPALRRTRSEEVTTADRREAPAAPADQATHVRSRPEPPSPPSRALSVQPAAADLSALAHERLARAARGHAEASVHRPDIAELAGASGTPMRSARPGAPTAAPVAVRAIEEHADEDGADADDVRGAEAAEVDAIAQGDGDDDKAAVRRGVEAAEATGDDDDAHADGPAPALRPVAPAPPMLEYAYHAQRTHRRVALLVIVGVALVLGFVAWKERLFVYPARCEVGARAVPMRPVSASAPRRTVRRGHDISKGAPDDPAQ